MSFLKRLDGYRGPVPTVLAQPRPVGGALRIGVVVLWLFYVVFTIIENNAKPDVVMTSIQPSSTFTDNLISFAMVDPSNPAYPTYFWGKNGNWGPCDRIGNFNGVNDSTPLCEMALGASACGVDPAGNLLFMPHGLGYFYSIENQSTIDAILDYTNGSMFSITTPSGSTSTEMWLDGFPYDQPVPRGGPGRMVLAVAQVTVSFQHQRDTKGAWTSTIQGTDITLLYQEYDVRNGTAMDSCAKNGLMYMDAHGDAVLEINGYTRWKGNVTLGGYTGLGMIVFVASDTTVIQVVTSAQQGLFALLGSFGGGYGLLMAVSRILYQVLDKWEQHKNRAEGNVGKKVYVQQPSKVSPEEHDHDDADEHSSQPRRSGVEDMRAEGAAAGIVGGAMLADAVINGGGGGGAFFS